MFACRRTVINAVFVALLVAIAANTLVYTAKAANPLIVADDWHFLDTIVRKAADGGLAAGDFFQKRSALDHSQPLRKVILLFHYRYFDLDYSVSALIGVLAALINLGIVWWVLKPQENLPWSRRVVTLAAFAAIAAVYLSLNSAVIYNWPLVTLSYTSHFFIFVFLGLAWFGFKGAWRYRLHALFTAAFLMDVVADDTGLIASIAAVLTILIVASRERRWIDGAKVTASILAGYVAYMLLVALVSVPASGSHVASGLSPSNLVAGLFSHANNLIGALEIPLIASIAHRVQLRALFGPDTTSVETVIAFGLVVGHAWFWWRALAGRSNLVSFVASALMLLFYGLVAGMLLARVSLHGADYLWQPRYVLIFEWNVIALLLMAVGQSCVPDEMMESSRSHSTAMIGRALLASASAFLLLLQLPLSYNSWTELRFVTTYQQRLAAQLGVVAADPREAEQKCAPMLIVCRYEQGRRVEVIRFLQAHRLNIFSPAFRARNRLYLDETSLPR